MSYGLPASSLIDFITHQLIDFFTHQLIDFILIDFLTHYLIIFPRLVQLTLNVSPNAPHNP